MIYIYLLRSPLWKESSSSIYSKTLQQDFLLWSVTAHFIDQTWEFYGYSSQHLAIGDRGIQNRSVRGKIFYIFDDKQDYHNHRTLERISPSSLVFK